MAEEFWEVGVSGRRYNREYVIDTLIQRSLVPHENEWRAEGFYCQEIAPDNYLFTYTLRQGARVTRRATIWRRSQDRWVAVYHQGTIAEAP